MTKKPHLVVIAGPTAVGKTSVAIEVANHFKTEIVNADSRQLYREMEIGTAVPSNKELEKVKHHFIQSHSVESPISAGDYEEMIIPLLDQLFSKHEVVVLSGGSGLYIDAVLNGFDTGLPKSNPELRTELQQLLDEKGIESLQMRLNKLDPEYYKQVDLNNSHRLIRAIEVSETLGIPYSQARTNQQKERRFDCIKICLNRNRRELYDRINLRVDQMIENGLVNEAKLLFPKRELSSLNTVGYSELFDHFEQKHNLSEAVELIKRNSRRYAKRQITWFKRDPDYQWFNPNELDGILHYVNKQKKV